MSTVPPAIHDLPLHPPGLRGSAKPCGDHEPHYRRVPSQPLEATSNARKGLLGPDRNAPTRPISP